MPAGCALSLAKELNYHLVMFWPKSSETGNARFDDLFDTEDLPFEIVDGRKARVIRAAGEVLSGRRIAPRRIFDVSLKIPLKFIGFQYDICLYSHRWLRRDLVVMDLRPYRKILLSTPRFFGRSCDVSWLKPAPHIIPRIIELKKKFTPNTIGVHIRGTDSRFSDARQNSLVEKIISRMRAEVELDPNVKFFFASDGDESENVIVDIFGDRLIRTTPATTLVSERRTVQGQQDAVVDLFGLASTSRLIGTWPSTFFILAAMIGNKPMIRVHPKDFVRMDGII